MKYTPEEGGRFYVDLSFEICSERNKPDDLNKSWSEKSEEKAGSLAGMLFQKMYINVLKQE